MAKSVGTQEKIGEWVDVDQSRISAAKLLGLSPNLKEIPINLQLAPKGL
jgi:hypothetical protein